MTLTVTDQEQGLIETYRQLPETGKRAVLRYAIEIAGAGKAPTLKDVALQKYGTIAALAKAMGYKTNAPVSLKLNGRRQWNSMDIAKLMTLLELSVDELNTYFFPGERAAQ